VEVFPLEPELSLVSVGFLGVIDAVEVELPGCAAVKRGLDGNAVSDFPVETFREFGAGDGSLTVFREVIPLPVGHHEFRINLAMALRVDHKLGKETLFILINAAEPLAVRDRLDAGHRGNLVSVRNGHEVHQADTVDDDESFVTIRTVLPYLPTSSSMSAMISSALLRSRSPVGSSQRRKVGSETIARAMVTRCS